MKYIWYLEKKERNIWSLWLLVKATLLFCERLLNEFVFGSGPHPQAPVNRQNKFSCSICKTPVNSWLCLNWSLFLIIWFYCSSHQLLTTLRIQNGQLKNKWIWRICQGSFGMPHLQWNNQIEPNTSMYQRPCSLHWLHH